MAHQNDHEAGDRDGAEGASGDSRLTAPPDASRPPRLPFPVVGIGASAGGLEAYSEFLRAAPADSGMAFVLVQHLPPDRESLLVELLAKQAHMPVLQVEDGQPVQPDRVYVIRPGHTLTIRDGRLWLGPSLAARGHSRPIDDFFRSLAEEQQQRAIAVVFSGMGSNGTAGAQAVKAVGGLVIAQDPESAKYPIMPRSLIDANLADFVLRPYELPGILNQYAGHPYARADSLPASVTAGQERELAEVLGVLRSRTRHDFAGYRKPTLLRRVQRRMGLTQSVDLGEYLRLLRQSPSEPTALADDLLIHVTGFFRDPGAWEALRARVIDPMTADRPDGSPVRCWVAACATGEEAYTLTMLLVEAAEARRKRFEIKVFATDMAERMLGHARSGVFPGGIESEVSPERLARFFDKDDSFYRIKREFRELVVFAPQNVLQDPPFSRLDIATCRNLLIYLEPETQRRVLALLHFGLREGGALMLGTSESVGPAEDQFEPIDKKHRLFRRVGPTRHGTPDFPLPEVLIRGIPLPTPAARQAGPATVAQLAGRALLEEHTPAAVAVDARGQVLYLHGETERYLRMPRGEPTHDLLALAHDQVRGAIRTALYRATDIEAAVTVRDGLLETPEGRRRVEVGAAPLAPRGASPLYLVTFRDHPEPPPTPPPPTGGDVTAERRLVEELSRTRDELQTALEEMQTSKEELKASHEEVTSINEELQSTNEELETSKEEMQSLNEELVTVNAELQAKMTELEGTSNDLASLLASTDIAVLFLDPQFRIRRFTPAVRDLLDLIPSDAGRPLADLRRKFDDPHLLADARSVLDRLVPVEREVDSESGRVYLRRVLPYRTQDNRIDGVVVTFVDISRRLKAEADLRKSEERLRALMRASSEVLYRMSADWGEMLELEGGAFLADATAQTETWVDRYVHPDDRPQVAAAIREAIRTKGLFDLEHRVIRSDGTPGWARTRAVPLLDRDGAIAEWFGAAGDVTDRKRTEATLRESEERLRLILASATDYGILTMDADRKVTGWSPGATATFGYSEGEIVGQTGDLLFIPEDRAAGAPEREAEEARRVGRAADERWHARKDSSRFYASGVLNPLGPGGALGFVKVLRDLTDRKRAEDALQAAHDQLEARVAERTAELAAAVAALEAEMGRRRGLARQLAAAQESERQRVSRDLHDTAGQLLAGLALTAAALRQESDLPPAAAARVAELGRLTDDLARELHALALRLRPTALDDVGLVAALTDLVRVWSSRSGVEADFQAVGLDAVRLPMDVETALYRVVQEALTNVAKHTRATTVSVVVARVDREVRVAVEDNGGGFDASMSGAGRLGLAGMRERVELVGGALEVESGAGEGTTVHARIPLAQPARESGDGG